MKIGDGATLCLYSDRHAYTIIAISKSGKTLTLQRDEIKLSDNFTLDVSKGGFLGHVNNNSEQSYTYSPNLNGEVIKARIHKDGKYYYGSMKVKVGVRSEFYDYNF